jgi:hypothetical protein
MLSLADVTLSILDLTDTKSKDIINGLDQIMLSDKLIKHRYNARTNRKHLIKSLNLKIEDEMYLTIKLPKNQEDLWSMLRYCGSGITQSMFSDIKIQGSIASNHKLLLEKYSLEFLERFEFLWKADKALRKIEWKLLRIGSFPQREDIINKLDIDKIDLISLRRTTLIDIIINVNAVISDVGKILLNKIKRDVSGRAKDFEKWHKLDEYYFTIILADKYDNKDDGYNIESILDLFITRIKSVKHLTLEFESLL